jgi:hypothetical protein
MRRERHYTYLLLIFYTHYLENPRRIYDKCHSFSSTYPPDYLPSFFPFFNSLRPVLKRSAEETQSGSSMAKCPGHPRLPTNSLFLSP